MSEEKNISPVVEGAKLLETPNYIRGIADKDYLKSEIANKKAKVVEISNIRPEKLDFTDLGIGR